MRRRYDIAISLAKNQSSETNETEIEIYEQYASHLYSKGNYNEAIAQYIKTIGRLEPSYVIRKFLDSQRIHNLTSYLKALHDKELADKHHTTLLLNCYTKLKDRNMLDEFIMTDRNLNFDLETAIVVCRQAGCVRAHRCIAFGVGCVAAAAAAAVVVVGWGEVGG